MKPPSTVEARVAEELRNWLSSELEQLDASNTNQFAHHVVTILLHEDLDIEDEPLSAGDDFLRDIYSIRRGKTRDKQKKAAVQFLRSAVCCNDPGEAEIQGVVDELMVRIEETKIRMNSKCSPKRTGVHTSCQQPGTKPDCGDRERLYDEAFPSLHPRSSNSTGYVWHRLASSGTDFSRDIGLSRSQIESAQRMLVFDSQEEAHACNTARRVFVSALPETVLPSLEATEILSSEQLASPELSDAYRCWSTQSAFQACSLLRKFLPTVSPLKPVSQPEGRHRLSKDFSPTVIPVINQSDLHNISLDPSYEKTLTDHPQLFRPIKEKNDRNNFKDTPQSETDVEVARIFKHHVVKRVLKKSSKSESAAPLSTFDGGGDSVARDVSRVSTEHQHGKDNTPEGNTADKKVSRDAAGSLSVDGKCSSLMEVFKNDFHCTHSPVNTNAKLIPRQLWDVSYHSRGTSQIDVCTVPQHHDPFWKLLTDAGSMALYPVVSNQLVFELDDKFETHRRKFVLSPLALYKTLPSTSTDDLTECQLSSDLLPDAGSGRWVLESACIQVQYHYAVRQEAQVQRNHVSSSPLRQTSLRNPFMPSLLSSCLSSEGSQILQRAFVNSYFSSLFQEPLSSTQEKLAGFRCSDLEHSWLSPEMLEVGGLGPAKADMVPGCTCSSWLENNCHLGDLCPFSHPSI